jgi:hypothetical protein
MQLLLCSEGPDGGALLTLHVEFDVADAVVPSSGIFSVKLARRGNGLGITITGTLHCKHQGFRKTHCCLHSLTFHNPCSGCELRQVNVFVTLNSFSVVRKLMQVVGSALILSCCRLRNKVINIIF